MLSRLHFWRLLLLFLAFSAHSSRCRADDLKTDEVCFDAYEQTQISLKNNRLLESQKYALICASGCPEEIANECATWVQTTRSELPSALLSARTKDGVDAVNVSVTVDGNSTPDALQEEVALDPGQHTFVFSRTDGWKKKVVVRLQRGEKRRTITVEVPSATSVPPAPLKFSPMNKTFIISSFSLAAVGYGLAIYGTVAAGSTKSRLNDCQAQGCDQTLIDKGHKQLTLADAGLVVGTVGVIAGVSLLIWGKKTADSSTHARLILLPSAGGAAARFHGTF